MDTLRDLLTAAAASVGWQVDLDQFPVTCAHSPDLVLALIEAGSAHLCALAADSALTEAARSIQTITADTDTVDWFAAELLGRVAHLARSLASRLGHSRRGLVTALRALHEEGAAWPPEPSHTAEDQADPSPDATVYPGLRQQLVALGLRQVPTADTTGTVSYQAVHDHATITVTLHPGDGYRTEIHALDHAGPAWSATFGPDTPNAVITAAIRRAVPAAGDSRHPDTT
jgi:hypothetical protein